MCCCCTMVKPRKKERKKCPLTLTTTNHQIPIACGHPSKYLKAKRDTPFSSIFVQYKYNRIEAHASHTDNLLQNSC